MSLTNLHIIATPQRRFTAKTPLFPSELGA